MTFQLDTSGAVAAWPQTAMVGTKRVHAWQWRDLDTFTQGFTEEMLRDLHSDRRIVDPDILPVHFSDLAPETLARIMEDCAAFRDPKIGAADWLVFDRNTGGDFWRDRQAGQLTKHSGRLFPPLTVALGDDGKVRFAQ